MIPPIIAELPFARHYDADILEVERRLFCVFALVRVWACFWFVTVRFSGWKRVIMAKARGVFGSGVWIAWL
jgi:hypothetical protein